MIRIILLFFLLIQFKATFGCLSADQNRIFPIGQSNKGWHVLEVQQSRNDADFKPIWQCVAYHKIYNEKHEVKQADSIQTLGYFPEGNYIKSVQFLFGKAIEIAKTNKTLKYLTPKSLYFCDYAHDNPEAKLSFDTLNNRTYVQLNSGKMHEVTVLRNDKSIARDLLHGRMEDENKQVNVAQMFQDILCINSVRKFNLGNKQLTIIHLGIGEFLSDANGNYPKPNPHFSKEPFNSIFNSIFFENVLHHGYGFDFMIWE